MPRASAEHIAARSRVASIDPGGVWRAHPDDGIRSCLPCVHRSIRAVLRRLPGRAAGIQALFGPQAFGLEALMHRPRLHVAKADWQSARDRCADCAKVPDPSAAALASIVGEIRLRIVHRVSEQVRTSGGPER